MKPCPVCGSPAEKVGEWNFTYHYGCSQSSCYLHNIGMSETQWENITVEDALQARITLEADTIAYFKFLKMD